MKAVPVAVGILCAAIVGAGVWIQSKKPAFSGVKVSTYNIKDVPRHPVTKQMEVEAASFIGNPLPRFTLPDTIGHSVDSGLLTKGFPSVIVMTKDGCPCSIEAQPFFTSMAKHYASAVKFVGLFDADSQAAAKFKNDFTVPYPILASETDTVFREFGAKQSVYTYLADREGKVVRVWPGYNKEMLNELNGLLSDLSGKESATLDMDMAPEKMTSGCFFFRPVGTDKPAW